MQYSGTQALAWLLLLIGTGSLLSTLGTHYWSTHHYFNDTVIEHRGLWRQCAIVQVPPKYGGGSYQVICKDRISSANVDKVFEMSGSGGEAYSGPQLEMIDTRVFEFVILVLILASVVLGVISLLIAPCCCNSCNCCVAFWTNIAAICSCLGCGLYAYFTINGDTVAVKVWQVAEFRFLLPANTLSWSFYLAVSGAICQLVSGLLFVFSPRTRRYSYSQDDI